MGIKIVVLLVNIIILIQNNNDKFYILNKLNHKYPNYWKKYLHMFNYFLIEDDGVDVDVDEDVKNNLLLYFIYLLFVLFSLYNYIVFVIIIVIIIFVKIYRQIDKNKEKM